MGGSLCAVSLPFDVVCDHALNEARGCLYGGGNYIHMMVANLKALEITMQELKERRDELLIRVSIEEDKGLQRLSHVQRWFSRVEEIESQVSYLLKAKSAETKRLCLFGYCSIKCISSCKYGKKVSKKLEEVKKLLSKGEFVVVAEKGSVPKVKEIRIQTETMVGLDFMVEKAWKSLMNGEHTKTLGLYGMGGVGKTTLLSRINNKFAEKVSEEVNEIDVVIWVLVSKDLQNESIQDQILGRLRSDKEWIGETEEDKAFSIYNILSRKRNFVLLLDDLWSKVDLSKIGVPPPTQDNGSKIVFTTRSKEVCKEMKADDEREVDCLSRDNAWKLFLKIVGEIPSECLPFARAIAEKCYGLPLVLSVIGKAMACKEDVQEWRHAADVLNSSSYKYLGMEKKILSILKFSYDGLEDENVKSCFLYCSLFPKDYEIWKEQLIEYWICEGFLDGNRDEDGSNNQGDAIIGSLVRARLLMDGEFTTMVKMHDVVREMALWIGSNLGEGEKNLVKRFNWEVTPCGIQLPCIPKDINWEVVRRISLMSNQIRRISCRGLESPGLEIRRISCRGLERPSLEGPGPECPNLSTLLLRNNNLWSISGEFFQSMPALIILDLSKNICLCYLPKGFSSLTSLQYLNLSRTRIRSLPMKGLRKLISLNLEHTLALESIDGIGTSLPNLQVLKLYGSGVYIDARLMEELQFLEQLTILTGRVKDALILESIQGIERLARCVQRLCIWQMSAQVVTLNTVALGGLRELIIMGSTTSEIKIDWEGPSSPCFKHLSTVHISGLEGPEDLTWLLLIPNLRYLTVMHSPSIEEIINREKGMSISNVHPDISVPFQKLELLRLINLPGLKRICSHPPSLPNLRKFHVEDCPELPKAATEFTSASGSNDITEVKEGDE